MSSSITDISKTFEVEDDVSQKLNDYDEENNISLPSMKRKYDISPRNCETSLETKDESIDSSKAFPLSTVKKVRFNVPSESEEEFHSCNSSQKTVQNESSRLFYSSNSSLNEAVINNQLPSLVPTDSTFSSSEESNSCVISHESDAIDAMASLTDYPHFDEFPDLENDDDDDYVNDCCPCDFSDRLGPSTSEPDVILYSERTSDTVTDCRYICAPPGRATGYSVLDVED